MENFYVEKMNLGHLDDVMEVEAKCYGKHHWSRASFVSEIGNPCANYLTVVNEANKCVGYMGVWRIIDEAHVTNLAVHPDFQGNCLAHFLILSSLKECYEDKIKYMTLEVRKSNERAKHIYEKFGFKSLGIRKKYYQDNNEDAIICGQKTYFLKNTKKFIIKTKNIFWKRTLKFE